MSDDDEDQLTLQHRLRLSSPRKPIPDAEPKAHYCIYCWRVIHVLPHEFRVCNAPECIRAAIADREKGIFDLKINLERTKTELRAEKESLMSTIADLEAKQPESLVFKQYKSLLTSLEANLGFNVYSDRTDLMLVLEKEIETLSKRISRPTFSDEFRRELWERDSRACYLCKGVVLDWSGEHMHIDHVRPRSRGGSDAADNLRITHPVCNLRKSNGHLDEAKIKVIVSSLRNSLEDERKQRLF